MMNPRASDFQGCQGTRRKWIEPLFMMEQAERREDINYDMHTDRDMLAYV